MEDEVSVKSPGVDKVLGRLLTSTLGLKALVAVVVLVYMVKGLAGLEALKHLVVGVALVGQMALMVLEARYL